MWQEFYEIAERQMFARKFNKVKGNALKALRLAIKARDHEGVVETYNLLADFYWYTRDRRKKDTIVASIKYAEKHLGGDSLPSPINCLSSRSQSSKTTHRERNN